MRLGFGVVVLLSALGPGLALAAEPPEFVRISKSFPAPQDAWADLGAPPPQCRDAAGNSVCRIVYLPVPAGDPGQVAWVAAYGKNLTTICVDQKTASFRLDCADPNAVITVPSRPLQVCAAADAERCAEAAAKPATPRAQPPATPQ